MTFFGRIAGSESGTPKRVHTIESGASHNPKPSTARGHRRHNPLLKGKTPAQRAASGSK